MKRIITLFTLLLLVFSVEIFAQSPTYFNYQAVIRDNSGGLLVDRLVHVKIAIREGNVSGPIAYQEVHSVTTNTFGLVNLVVGAGAPLQGTMPTVDWGANPHFIDIELDANNTGVYTQMGTTQILSVPYALHARTVQFNDDADADPTNEIQTFVLQNNELYLDNNGNGGFMVNLNPYLDNTDNQVLSVFDSTTTIRNMLISGGNKVTFSIADNDNDSINEIQQVSILNDTIYLSRGGFIDLKPYLDNTDEQTLNLVNDTLVISGSNDTISLSDYRQRISLLNDTITLSGTSDTLNLLPYLDNTDEQTLTIANDTLVISGSNDTIPLSDYRQRLTLQNDTLTLSGSMDTLNLVPYLDNTDEQALTLTNDTLVISGSNDTISLSNYRQELSLNGDTLLISGGNSIVLPPDSDGDSTNEVQSLSLNGNELTLSISEDTLDLSGYLDNSDNQSLSLINDTLVISGSNDTISLVPYKQVLSVSNDTIFLTDGGFVELPSPVGIPDLERVGDSINVQGSFTRVSVNDNDADSTNELQTLTFSNDTLILSETQDTIDFSGYSLRIDTNAVDIASLYIELDNDSTFLNDLIDSNLVLIGANQTLATGASNLANQNAIDITDLNIELDEDSTNFDTLISNLQSTQQLSDSMIYAKIASDSTNFDSLITNLRFDLSDTSSTLRGLISTASTQALSDLSDTASALRVYTNMVSSQDSGVVHGALADTASDIRTDYLARFSQIASDLSDTSSTLRGLISAASTQALSDLSDTASVLRMYTNMVSSQDSGVVHGALADTANDIRSDYSTRFTQITSDLSDTSSTLRGLISATSTQASSDLSDTASALRMYTNMVSSQDSGVVHGALTDSASNIRADYAARFVQIISDLTDSSNALRSTIIDSTDAIKSILAQTNTKKVNLTAIVDPVSTDDLTFDYEAGSYWLNGNTGRLFVCVQSTFLSAIWVEVTNIDVQSALEDSTIALKAYGRNVSSSDSSTVHQALIDTAGDLRAQMASNLSSSNSNLADTSSVLRGIIATSSSQDSSIVHNALVDTAGDLRSSLTTEITQVNTNLSDTASVLRGLIRVSSSSDSSTVHNALTDTAGDLRTGISASLAQANSNLSDTSTVLRGMIKVASSSDSSVVHNALLDSSSAIRGAIPAASTDDQNLTLNAGRTLSIESGNTVDLRVLSDSSISALGDTASAIRTSINNLDVKQSNFTAIVDPVTTNDLSEGYEAGSYWLNAATGKMFVCVASGLISATWVEVTNPTVQSALEDSASAIRSSIPAASTDDQNLTLNSGRTLSIEGGNTVDLRVLSDSAISALADSASAIRGAIPSASTDDQNLTLNAGRTLSIEGGNTVDLRVLSDSAISALADTAQAIRSSVSGGGGVTAEFLNNKLDTVTEFIYMAFEMDASNNVYLPINGTDENSSINGMSVSLLAPHDGQVISASVRTNTNFGFSIFYFHKNLNTTPTNNIGYGSLTGGTTNKTDFTGTIANRSFNQGDLVHFRFFSPIDAPANQILYFTIEVVYFK